MKLSRFMTSLPFFSLSRNGCRFSLCCFWCFFFLNKTQRQKFGWKTAKRKTTEHQWKKQIIYQSESINTTNFYTNTLLLCTNISGGNDTLVLKTWRHMLVLVFGVWGSDVGLNMELKCFYKKIFSIYRLWKDELWPVSPSLQSWRSQPNRKKLDSEKV